MFEINTCTKDEQVIVSNFIDIALSELGFNNITKVGFIYYKSAIISSLYIQEDNIILNELYKTISLKYNKPVPKIKKNIDNLFKQINLTTFKSNFKRIFKINFEYSYTTPKNFLILFSNLLRNQR